MNEQQPSKPAQLENAEPNDSKSAEEQQGALESRGEKRRIMPRIYVASLADYNAGRLHGVWVDATMPAEQLHERVQEMLAHSPEPVAEEWGIHDYEGFYQLRLSEFESFETISNLANGIAERGPAYAAWASLIDFWSLDQLERFDGCYRGTWDTVEAYAEEFLEDIGGREALEQVPEWLQPYVKLDVEGFARDLMLGGDIHVIEDEDGVHVFTDI